MTGMTHSNYRTRIAALGLSQVQAGELFGCTGRTGQTWAKDGPPTAVAMVLLAVRGDRDLLNRLCARAMAD